MNSPAEQSKHPPRVRISKSRLYEMPTFDEGGPTPDAVWVMTVAEHTEALAKAVSEARAEAYLAEVTYWLGEHRAYLETGMIWESELAMKNSRRYGELAKGGGGG